MPESPQSLPENFNAIVRAAMMSKNDDALQPVYESVFRLPVWHFVADAELPDKPQLWSFEGEICILIFTTEQDAMACADSLGFQNANETYNLFSVRVPDAVKWLSQLPTGGIERAMFNAAGEGESFPLELEDAAALCASIRGVE